MINGYAVDTCAPIEIAECLVTITTNPYLTTPADSPIRFSLSFDIKDNVSSYTDLHLTDPHGKVSCVPSCVMPNMVRAGEAYRGRLH